MRWRGYASLQPLSEDAIVFWPPIRQRWMWLSAQAMLLAVREESTQLDFAPTFSRLRYWLSLPQAPKYRTGVIASEVGR